MTTLLPPSDLLQTMDLKTHFKTSFQPASSSHSSQNPLAPPDASPDFNCPPNNIVHTVALEDYQTRIGNIYVRRLARLELHNIFTSWFDFTKRFETLPMGRQREEESQPPSRQHNPSAEAFRLFDSQQDPSPSQPQQSQFRLFDTQEQPSPSTEQLEESASQLQFRLFGTQKQPSISPQLLKTQQLNLDDVNTGYGAPEAVVAPTSPERSKNEWGQDLSLKGAALTALERMAARVGRRSRVGSCWYCFMAWSQQVRESKRLFLVADAIVQRWDAFTCHKVLTAWQAKCLAERHLRWVVRMVSNKSWRNSLYFHFHGWNHEIIVRLEEEQIALRLRGMLEQENAGKDETALQRKVVTKEDAQPPQRKIAPKEDVQPLQRKAPPTEDAQPLMNGKKTLANGSSKPAATADAKAIASDATRAVPKQDGAEYDTVLISGMWNLSAFKSEDGIALGGGAGELSWGAQSEGGAAAEEGGSSQRKARHGAFVANGSSAKQEKAQDGFDLSSLWSLGAILPGSGSGSGAKPASGGKAGAQSTGGERARKNGTKGAGAGACSELIEEKAGAGYDTVFLSGLWNLSAVDRKSVV